MVDVTTKYIIAILFLFFSIFISQATLALGWTGNNLEGLPCEGKGQGYGPYDYTNPYDYNKMLPRVEQAHFNSDVERLIRGVHLPSPIADLDYTLRAFPNHHKALYAIVRYQLRIKKYPKKYKPLMTAAECYLNRAIKFKPDDGIVYQIYGIYLHRLHRYKLALDMYKKAEKLITDSSEIYYNIGLCLYDMKKYDESAEYAKIAIDKGYPLHALQKKLMKRGFKF